MSFEQRGKVVLARVEDTQIGADTADEFRSKVQAEIQGPRPRIAIDLSQVDFMDSSGLGALVALLKAVRPQGDLVLYGMKASVLEIMRLTHLDAVFSCEADEAAAIATLQKASSPA